MLKNCAVRYCGVISEAHLLDGVAVSVCSKEICLNEYSDLLNVSSFQVLHGS